MRAALSAARCLTASAILQRGMMQAVWHQQQLHQQCLQGSSSSRSLGVARQALWQQRHSSSTTPTKQQRMRRPAAAAAGKEGMAGASSGQLQEQPLTPSTDVRNAVVAAVLAVGRTPGAAELVLAERLQANLYTTAGDVVGMSQEERELLNVPVKLWAVLQAQLLQQRQQEQTQHVGDEDKEEQEAARQSSAAGVAAAVIGSAQPPHSLPADIMQRRMPPDSAQRPAARAAAAALQQAAGDDSGDSAAAPRVPHVRTSPLKDTAPYGLRQRDISRELDHELEALSRFCTSRWFGQLSEPILPVTFRTVTRAYVLRLLGYLHSVRGVPLQELSLRSLVPSSKRSGVDVLLEYQRWRQAARGTAASTAELPIKALTHVARFLYHDAAKPPSQTGLRPYHDLPVIQELAAMQRSASKAASGAARVTDESAKFMTWPEYLQFVAALRAECAGLTTDGRPRSRKQVALSLQRYLIAAILSVVPDRQRTLRELEVGRTLVQRDGAWVITHAAADYKTGKQYGDRPPLVLAPFLYPELEAFIGTWRQELNPGTPRLFVRPGSGEPLTERALYSIFKSAALRLTGKATNPHLVRDMIVTHARMSKTSEATMEALAVMMGHSLAMQRSSYDRRSKAQKVAPSLELLAGLWGSAGSAGAGGGGPAGRVE